MPAIRTLPRSCLSVPEITLNSVVLPAPFGPTRPTISPSPTASETPSSARTPPNRTPMSISSSTFCRHGRVALREQPEEAARREQDHRRQQRAEDHLMPDGHDGLEQKLIDEIHDERADDRPGQRAIAAED